MGVHVILDIDLHGMDERAWAAVHDETLALLEAWQPRLLGLGARVLEGVRVPMYVRSLRGDTDDPLMVHWSIAGDLETLQMGEPCTLYRHVGRHAPSVPSPRPRGAPGDIVVAASLPGGEGLGGTVRVFGQETHGHPYHFAVLAAAMVVEERFPGHALVSGDIDRGQAELARHLAAPLLGRELPLPVRVDAARLLERLRPHHAADVLPAAFERVFLGEVDETHEAMLRVFPGDLGAHAWQRALAEHGSPGAYGALRLLIAWLNAGRPLREACWLACIAPEGPRFPPEAFVEALASAWVALPLHVRAPIDALRKPSGASYTLASQFSSYFLDLGAMGRRLRAPLEPAALADDLAAVFGDQGAALAARLNEKSAEIEAQLRESAGYLNVRAAEANAVDSDDTEELVALCSADEMGLNQQGWVRRMAWRVIGALNALRESAASAASRFHSLEQSRNLLTRILAQQTPVLTEDAWEALLAESDPEVFAWCISLLCIHAGELHQAQVRRAFLENAELRRHAFALGDDEQAMREIGKMIEEERAR